MNERIQELARQSGATAEDGSRATTVFCFTDQELKGFAELIVQECIDIANDTRYEGKVVANRIKFVFGVES